MRHRLLLALSLLTFAAACRDCEDLGPTAPSGGIRPNPYDFGPITRGSVCTAQLEVTNTAGRTDLAVNEARLEDSVGTWRTVRFPRLVRLGGSEVLEIEYTADGEVGDAQSTRLELATDDPDDDGLLTASLRAIVTDAPAPAIKTECGESATSPCTALDFGAQQINGAGRILSVTVVNDGTADLELSYAGVLNGDPAFQVLSVRRGSAEVSLPAVVPPGRTGECGATTDEDNTLTIDVKYSPMTTGANADTLTLLSNAINDLDVEIALTGVGSDVGIVITPDIVDFGELPEGESDSVSVTALNIGTNEARVDESCIDLENDDICDAPCTGTASDTTLDGTLSCRVTRSGGSNEGKGFILGPTDARPGGDDERTVTVTWAPVAGATVIPPTAVLALHSAILGDRIFTAPLKGGAIGLLEVSAASDDRCPGGAGGTFCIEATGDAGDHTTWAGEITLRLTNVGSASLTISAFEFEGAATINDDFTITPPATLTIAPGASTELVIAYDEVGAGADAAASQQATNLLVRHNGVGAVTTIPLDVVPPQ